MATIVTQRDIGSLIAVKRVGPNTTALAAGTGDATSVTGVTIDRFGFSASGRPDSMVAAIVWEATLGTGLTLSLGYAVQDSADNSVWSDYQTATFAVVATGSTAASVLTGQFEANVNLTTARRYVRLNFQPDLSAGSVDTAAMRPVAVFGGFDRLPQ